jgi:hypothetical protein
MSKSETCIIIERFMVLDLNHSKTKSVKYNPLWIIWYIHQNLIANKWHKKLDISHVIKFDETFYNIWVHRLTLIFKAEKLWKINGIIQKLIAPTIAQIIVGTWGGGHLG